MNKIIYKISLDLSESVSNSSVNTFQGEVGAREISAGFRIGGREYVISDGTSAVFRAKRPDGTLVYNTCRIENGRVNVTLSSSLLSSSGEIRCQILLNTESGETLYSPEFNIINHSPVVSDEEIEGTDEFSVLREALEEVKAIKNSLEKGKGFIFNGTTTSQVPDIVINKDNKGNALSLTDDFTIYIDAPASQVAGSVYIYFNSDIGAYVPNGVTKSGGKSRITMHYNGRTWENYSVTSTAFASNGTVTSIVRYEVDDVINEIRLNFAGGFPVGTKYYIYGRVK